MRRSCTTTAFVLTDTFLFFVRRYLLYRSATFIISMRSDVKKILRRFPSSYCDWFNFSFLSFFCITVVAHSIASETTLQGWLENKRWLVMTRRCLLVLYLLQLLIWTSKWWRCSATILLFNLCSNTNNSRWFLYGCSWDYLLCLAEILSMHYLLFSWRSADFCWVVFLRQFD